MTTREHGITIEKTIRATPDAVYAAWTEPAVMARWLAKTVEADVRVGGRYRNVVGVDEGVTYVHEGTYLELEPGRRIVQTFSGGPDEAPSEPSPYTDETLEISLRPLGASETALTFVNGWNGKPMNEQEVEAVTEAWTSWLERLDRLFAPA